MKRRISFFQLRKRYSKGFTLLGVLIALTIITIGMWLMMNAFRLASEGINASKRRIQALNYAQQVMENYIIEVDFNDSNLNTTTHNLGTTSDGFTKSYDVWFVRENQLYQSTGSSEYKRVEVKVQDNKGLIGDITLETIKTDFQG